MNREYKVKADKETVVLEKVRELINLLADGQVLEGEARGDILDYVSCAGIPSFRRTLLPIEFGWDEDADDIDLETVTLTVKVQVH